MSMTHDEHCYCRIETTKDGVVLKSWQIPLDKYMRSKPGLDQKWWRNLHAIACVRAREQGHEGVRDEQHTEEELAEAAEKLKRVRKYGPVELLEGAMKDGSS